MLITLILYIYAPAFVFSAKASYCENESISVQDYNTYSFEYNDSCVSPHSLILDCPLTYNHMINIIQEGMLNVTSFTTNCQSVRIQATNIIMGDINTNQLKYSIVQQKVILMESSTFAFIENSNVNISNYLVAIFFNLLSGNGYISNLSWYSYQLLIVSNNSINFNNSRFHISDKTCSNQVNILPSLHNIFGVSFDEVEQYLNTSMKNYSAINFTLFLEVSNYTVFIFSRDTITFNTTTLLASQVGIMAKEMFESLNSTIDTSGKGCEINQGNARGPVFVNYNQKCYGNGGSNAGYGGIGLNQLDSYLEDCIFLTNSTRFMFNLYPYGYLLSNIYQGSGGSSANILPLLELIKTTQLTYGYGGGSIFLYSNRIKTQNSSFSANGSPGYLAENNSNISSGGGAGGSVKIYSSQIQSDNSTTISVQGGDSDATGNVGEGSGGVVQYKCIDNVTANAQNLSQYCSNNTFYGTILNSKGSRIINEAGLVGQNGNLLEPICPPGSRVSINFSCIPCPERYYSLWWSQQCIPCPYTYGKLGSGLTFCNYPPQCSQQDCCIEDFRILRNTGIQLVIFVLLIIIGYALRRHFKKRDKVTEKNFDFVHATKDIVDDRIITASLVENDQFVLADLLYHAHRIHVIGNNTFLNPWYLHLEPPIEIEQAINREEFEKFAKNFNKFAQWSKTKYVMLNILALLYYPLYWGWQTKIKKDKFQLLSSYLNKGEINKFWKQQSDDSYSRFKITKSTDYTLLYIDIFNYKNCELKYIYLTCPFIIYLSGEGNYVRPFYLCESDQFLVSLFFAVNKTKNSTENRQNILLNLVSENERQENSKEIRSFLKKFNKVAMTLDFGALAHNFISNFRKLFDLLEKWNTIFFNDHNVKLQLIIAQYPFDVSHQSACFTLIEMKSEQKFKAFLKELHQNVTLQKLQDVKFGVFIFNTDLDPSAIEQQLQNQKFSFNEYDDLSINRLEHEYDEECSLDVGLLREQFLSKNTEKDQQQLAHVKHQFKQITQKQSERPNSFSKSYHILVRIFDYIRFQAFSHKKTFLDKYTLIIMICILILLDNFLLQSILSLIIEKQKQTGWNALELQLIFYPYPFAIILSNLFESVWIPSQSYGILKLYLIFNAMAILQYVVSLIITASNSKFCIKDSLTVLSLLIKIALNQLSERLIPMSTKLNQLSSEKNSS